MESYFSYGTKEHFCDIIFNNYPSDASPVTVHEIGTSAAGPGHSKVFVRESYYIHFVKKGYGYFMNERVNAGSGYIMIPGEYSFFAASEDDPWEQTWIQVDGKGAKEFLERSGFQNRNHIFTHSSVPEMCEILHKAVYADYQKYDNNLKFLSILYEILSLHRLQTMPESSQLHKNKSDNYLYSAVKYIKENYSRDITTTEIANAVNLSPNHLCKIFKKSTDLTVKNYIIRHRISEAQKLLTETNLNINEISNSVGYYDSMYFSQVFRRYGGYTPSQYREKYKNIMKKK